MIPEFHRFPEDRRKKKLLRLVFVEGGYDLRTFSFKEDRWYTLKHFDNTNPQAMDELWMEFTKRLINGYIYTDYRDER